MSQSIHANPDEMDVFALHLKSFNERLAEEMSRLRGAFARVGETWTDAKYRSFADEFIRTMTLLENFGRASEDFIGYLYSESAFLRQYLDRNLR
jgi:uncharacterized protein YukE